MCRWFAYISNEEQCLLEDVLILPDHAISKQVDDHWLPGLWPWETETTDDDTPEGLQNVYDRNFMNNSDGLGIAWYSMTRSHFIDPKNPKALPTLYKTLSNPPTDPNFISICSTTATHALFAHIRAASPAMPVNEANCHPFVFGKFTFMHNGGVGDFQAIKKGWIARTSEEAYAKVMGITDSEHLAAMFFTILSEKSEAAGEPAGTEAWNVNHPVMRYVETLDAVLATVLNLQRDFVGKRGKAPSPSSLNMCVTDGDQLVALRFRSHVLQDPPSLYWTDEAGVVLNRKFEGTPNDATANQSASNKPPPKNMASHAMPHATAEIGDATYGTHNKTAEDHGSHLIVASEPTTKTDVAKWHVVAKNSYVIRGKDQKVALKDIGIDWQKEIGTK